jgi:3-oxoacyl-[acyl-carrier protein] reductase
MELSNKVALITGASRGIGSEIARALAGEGAAVVVNYNGSKEKAEALAGEINKAAEEAGTSGRASVYGCNVADFGACGEMITSLIAEYGHIDILVNNAGITRDGLIMKMSEEEFDSVVDTNLKGAFNTIRHMSRYFLKQKSGRIINISSVSGVMGNAGQTNYSASKAGVIGLTKSVARELASRGITCNAIAPGFIETEMTEVMTDQAKAAVMGQIPMQRAGATKDVAELVTFLASDRASYITGQVIAVDGGMCM